MEAESQAPQSLKRVEAFALAGLILLGLAGVYFLVHPWYDATTDGSIYLLCAKSLLRGEGYSYLGEGFHTRPPGLSVLLMPFVGGDELNFLAINRFIASFAVATLALFFLFFRERLGWLVAAAAAVAIACLPGFQRLASQVMTDVPGAALLLLCLWLERRGRRSKSLAWELALGLSIGLFAWLRTAAILLVPAILLSRLLRKRSADQSWRELATGQLIPFATLAILVALPWNLSKSGPPPEQPVDQTLQFSTAGLIFHEDPGDPDSARVPVSEILARMGPSSKEAVGALGIMRLVRRPGLEAWPEPSTRELIVGSLLMLALLISMLRWRRPEEFYVLAFLGVTLLFPSHFLDRYAFPILLIALPASLELLRAGLDKLPVRRWRDPLLAGALFLWAGLAFEPRGHWDFVEQEHRDLVDATDKIEASIGSKARLGAAIGPHFSLLLDRPVHSLRFAFKRTRQAASAEQVIDRYRLNVIALFSNDRSAREFQAYFASKYRKASHHEVGEKRLSIYRVRGN